jgi:hypothetical protein
MRKLLLYRTADHNDALVFATEDRARLVARMHAAICSSKTWADFRRAMPRKEYSAIVRYFDDVGERRPKGADEFSDEQVPGWSEGDFPPWLQPEMSCLLPQSVLRQFGTLESTVHNGSFWRLPPEAAQAISAELEALGWQVQHAPELQFW